MTESQDAAVVEAAGPSQRGWSAVKDAIRGTHHDYTEGAIGRAIFLLAVPMVLETVMESVFAVVDVFFVSRLGADAVATVGLSESMMVLVYSLAMGLGIGATATVGGGGGGGEAEGAAEAADQAVLLGLIVTVVVGLVGVILAPTLLRIMGGSPAVIANAAFMQLMVGGNATVLLLFLINAVFGGAD